MRCWCFNRKHLVPVVARVVLGCGGMRRGIVEPTGCFTSNTTICTQRFLTRFIELDPENCKHVWGMVVLDGHGLGCFPTYIIWIFISESTGGPQVSGHLVGKNL